MKTSVALKISGQTVPLKTSDRDEEKVQEILIFVQGLITQAEKRCKPHAPPFQPLLLALLDLSEEYMAAKKRVGEHHAEFARASTRLIEILETELKNDHS